jgi:hypothetical protein
MQVALVLIFGIFAGSGFARWVYSRAVREGRRLTSSDQHLEAHPSGDSDV